MQMKYSLSGSGIRDPTHFIQVQPWVHVTGGNWGTELYKHSLQLANIWISTYLPHLATREWEWLPSPSHSLIKISGVLLNSVLQTPLCLLLLNYGTSTVLFLSEIMVANTGTDHLPVGVEENKGSWMGSVSPWGLLSGSHSWAESWRSFPQLRRAKRIPGRGTSLDEAWKLESLAL